MVHDSVFTLWSENLVQLALSRTVSEINGLYAEIQYARKKLWEIDFWQKEAYDCVYSAGRKFHRKC